MKKILKGNLKRWIAFLLAVVLIATTCVYSSDAFLRAEGDETQAENQTEPASEEVEVIPTEVDEPEQDPEPEAEESNEEETEEETEEEPVEEDVVEIPAEAPEEPDVNPEETTTPEVLPESPETTPEQPADPSVSPAIDPSASPSVSPSAVPSASPEKEEGEVYSYTICYYYDGVEDEDARVEKEDGVLNESIIDASSVKAKVIHNGENYELDKIENEDGVVTEDSEKNVVSIYYALLEEEEDPEGKYSYEIRFHFDGVEDTSVRIEKENGVLGNQILDSDSVEEKVTHNKKSYVLDTIKNKNGKITEDETANVVNVYYVLEKESKLEQTLTATADDGAKIKVVGKLPEGAQVKVETVSVTSSAWDAVEKSAKEDGKELVELKLYDITIWDADGNEIQPDDTVKVTITGAGVKNGDAAVYHVEDGNAEKVADVASGNNAQFDAEHFSVYGVGISVLAEEDKDGGLGKKIKLYKNTNKGQLYGMIGGETYSVGDVIQYCINVENSSTNSSDEPMPLQNIEIKDDFSGVGKLSYLGTSYGGPQYDGNLNFICAPDSNVKYNEDSGHFLIDKLESGDGKNIWIICQYEVQEEDAGKSITNAITLKSSGITLEYEPDPVSVKIEEPETYTVTYVLNGGTVEGEITDGSYDQEKGEVVFAKVSAGANTPIIPDPVREGYVFEDWNPKIAETVTKDVTYEAIYTRDTKKFAVNDYEGEYNTDRHQLNVDDIKLQLKNGEKIQYQYDGKWLDASEMGKNWPINVNGDGLKVPVRVVDEKGEVVWDTKEHPCVKVTPRKVTIIVPDVEKEFNKLNNYSFEEDSENINYTYDGILSGGLDNAIKKELLFIKDLQIKRTDANKDENSVTTYNDALQLTRSEDDLNGEFTNFIFTVDKGNFTIKTKEDINAFKVELTSQTGDDGVTYDGKEYFVTIEVILDGVKLSKEEIEAQGISFTYAEGDGYINGPQKDAGSNCVRVVARTEGYQDATSNTVIVKINPKEVTVTAKDATTVLKDGAEITYSGEINVDGLISGDTIGTDGGNESDVFECRLADDISYNSVGEIENAVELIYDSEDINPNYSIKLVCGKLDVQGTVTYDANDSVSGGLTGSVPEDLTAYSKDSFIQVEFPAKGSFKKEGATFLGWTRDKHQLVTQESNIPSGMLTSGSVRLTMGNENITLYAVWAQDTNNDNIPDYEQNQVIYNLNGGNADPEPKDSGYYDVSDTAILISYDNEGTLKPTKTNAVFMGWSNDSAVSGNVYEKNPTGFVVSEVTFETAGNITVYAVWAKDEKGPEGTPDGIADYLEHAVTYNDPRFNITAPVDSNLYPEGYKVTLKEGLAAPSKLEHQLIAFDSWKNESVEISTDEAGESTFSMPNGPVTFDAQWKSLTISKEVTPKDGGYKVGEDMLFTIRVNNVGDVDLTNITVSEDLIDAKLVDGNKLVESMRFDLQKNESKELQAKYEVKDADIQNSLMNTVKAKVEDDEATATVNADKDLSDAETGLEVTKTIVDTKESYAIGDRITFKVTVKNTGNVTVKDITVTDAFEEAKVEPANFFARMVNKVREWLTGWESGNTSEQFDLKPGKTKELTVVYTVQETDLGHSGYWNVATATGKSAIDNVEVKDSANSEPINVADAEQKVSLQKQVVEPSAGNDFRVEGKYPVGSTVQYRVTVTNTGNTTLNEFVINDEMTYADGVSVVISDDAIGNIAVDGKETEVNWNGSGFTIGTLARNDTLTFTYTYTVQPEDAGKEIRNAVVPGDGIEKDGEGGTSDPVVVVDKGLSVTKKVTSTPNGTDDKYILGQQVDYEVTITNTGNVALENIHVDDQFNGFGYGALLKEGESDVIPSLAAGDSETLHYTYQIREEDLGKKIANIATATAGDGTEGKNPEDQAEITTEDSNPQASIEKEIVKVESDGNESDYQENSMVKVGDIIYYRITVTNTGNTTLENIKITDQMNGKGTVDAVSGGDYDSGTGIFTIGNIEPNQERNASKTINYCYTVVEADKGLTIKNTAQINDEIKDENGNTPSDEKEVTVENESVEMTKEIAGVVRNGELIPVGEGDQYSTGDIVQFTVTVTNNGNVDLAGIEITDTMTGAPDAEGNGPEAVFIPTEGMPSQTIDLKVGEKKTLTYQYTVRSADVDNNTTPVNTAKASLGEPSEQVSVPISGQRPAYEVEKKLHDSIEGIYAGEEITYDILVKNTGNTTLSGVAVDDQMSYVGEQGKPQGAITVTSGNADWVNGQFVLKDPLAWGENVLIQYTYTVTEEDAGKTIRNTAYGKDEEGEEQPSSSEDVTIEKKSLEVVKVAKTKKDKYALGENIEFEVTVKNTGNVTLSNIIVNDQMQNADAEADFVRCEGADFAEGKIIELASNAKATLVYQYTVRENDLGKSLLNEVEAHVETEPTIKGDDIVGGLHVAEPETRASLTKTITSSGTGADGKYKLNDVISYQIVVTNTGNTTLENVVIKDTMTGASGRMYATNVSGATIESATKTDDGWEYELKVDQPILPHDPSKPDQNNTATILCTYRIKEADIGKTIGNVAVVDNDNVIKEDPENPNPIEVEKKELTVVKTANEPEDGESYKLGETITFNVLITNTGNVTLSDITVTDDMVGAAEDVILVEGNASGITLDPDGSVSLTYEYVVRPGDITSQTAIKNTVTATAGDGTTGYDETKELEIDGQHPAFDLNKSVTSTGSAEGGRYTVGDSISYQIVLGNTGNVALPSGMTVRDQMTGASGEISNVRAAITNGEPAENDFSENTVEWNDRAKMFVLNGIIPIDGRATIIYDYVVTAEDAGSTIKNTAGKITDPGSKTTTTEIAERSLSVSKEIVGGPQDGNAYVMGENILFKVTVTNTGNVTIDDITVADQMQNAAGSAVRVDAQSNVIDTDEPITLAAKASTVLYYSYTVDRNDIELMENGSGKTIWNSVTVGGENLDHPDTGENPDLTDETDPIQLDREYVLTVIYQYADGSEAAPSRTVRYAYGQVFTDTMILSPDINGYTPNMRSVGINTTLKTDSTVTITYVAIPAEPSPVPEEGGTTPDPEVPGEPDVPVPGTPPVVPVPPIEEETVPVAPPVVIAASPAVVGAGLTAVPDAEVPLDGIITQDDDGNIVIVPVEDMEVPLADREIDDHKCCIMSFLLMLATLIIYSWFTHSMKKRQKKLAELKDQLAEETLKRQLGITDKTGNRR